MKQKTTKTIKPTTSEKQRVIFPLHRINLILMAIAGVMIILGFILMCGDSSSMEEFNPDIFSTRRIVIAPTVAFIGFAVVVYGILVKPGKKHSENKEQ